MKNIIPTILSILLLPILANGQQSNPFKDYVNGVNEMQIQLSAGAIENQSTAKGDALTAARSFLQECIGIGEQMQTLPGGSRLQELISARVNIKTQLVNLPFYGTPFFNALLAWEARLYEPIGVYANANLWRKTVKRRKDLFERKYFGSSDEQGNYLELILNGKFASTRFDDKDLTGNNRGVSPWEVTARTEPLYLFGNKEGYGALFAFGLLYNFFPETDEDSGKSNTNFLTEYVEQVGFRIGGGYRTGDISGAIAGVGLQVHSITGWAVYDEATDDTMFAVGLSDFEIIKPYLPWFGK